MAERETQGRVLFDSAEVAQDILAHWLERFEAVAGAGGMAADALAQAVVDGDEHSGPALLEGHGLGHVGPPHHIHRRGGNGAIVRALLRTADPVRRE